VKKQPTSITAGKNQLKHAKANAFEEINKALSAASEAIDELNQVNLAMRRILISERAQVIYYTEKYRAFVCRECVEVVAIGFLDLSEGQQEKYIKLAVVELQGDAAILPHDPEAAKVEESAEPGKKIIQ